jgi:hypothetical protein
MDVRKRPAHSRGIKRRRAFLQASLAAGFQEMRKHCVIREDAMFVGYWRAERTATTHPRAPGGPRRSKKRVYTPTIGDLYRAGGLARHGLSSRLFLRGRL